MCYIEKSGTGMLQCWFYDVVYRFRFRFLIFEVSHNRSISIFLQGCRLWNDFMRLMYLQCRFKNDMEMEKRASMSLKKRYSNEIFHSTSFSTGGLGGLWRAQKCIILCDLWGAAGSRILDLWNLDNKCVYGKALDWVKECFKMDEGERFVKWGSVLVMCAVADAVGPADSFFSVVFCKNSGVYVAFLRRENEQTAEMSFSVRCGNILKINTGMLSWFIPSLWGCWGRTPYEDPRKWTWNQAIPFFVAAVMN